MIMANKVIASRGNNEVTRNDNPSMGMISLFLSLPKNHVLYGQIWAHNKTHTIILIYF